MTHDVTFPVTLGRGERTRLHAHRAIGPRGRTLWSSATICARVGWSYLACQLRLTRKCGSNQEPSAPGTPQRGQRPLDAVLTGIITRYDDRQGSALLVDQPASVAYEAYLISARDGEILWRARFYSRRKGRCLATCC